MASREPNFLFLFCGLVALIIGVPLLQALLGRSFPAVPPVGHSVLLLAGVWTLATSPASFWLGVVLVAASIAITARALAHPSPLLSLASLGIAWSFCLLTIALCLRHVFARGRVTVNHLLGATCVYLLLGALWGLGYAALHVLRRDSFRASDPADAIAIDDLMYFSFVTLTTTGFGDIVPVGRLVRIVVALEGVVGQLYVASLVATLVSQYVSPTREPPV